MSSELIPEKFAMYFSTMNSLASKICSEIKQIEETINYSDSEPLSYDKRCAIIDKCLIYDVIHPKGAFGKEKKNKEVCKQKEQKKFEPVVFNDECLDQVHTDSMIRFVYPKKPEKYVFDENGCWVDEHSEPFSYCKQSQVKCCKLGELGKKLIEDRVITGGNNNIKKNEVDIVSSSQKNSYKKDESKKEENISRKDLKKKSKAPFFGINVMGGFNNHVSVEEKISEDYIAEESNRKRTNQHSTEADLEDEDLNLPKQKQNLDLIAELQAKLNKGKMSKNIIILPPSSNENMKIPGLDFPHPASAAGTVSPSTVGKISKPKAPPPPPPTPKSVSNSTIIPQQQQKQKELLVDTNNQLNSNPQKLGEETFRNEAKKDEFLVDVSSPCRIVTPKTGFDFLDNW